MKSIICILSLLILSNIYSCTKEGCKDSFAINYDSKADKDDGSCQFAIDDIIGNYKGNCTSQNNSHTVYFHIKYFSKSEFIWVFDSVPSFMGNKGDSLNASISKDYSMDFQSGFDHGIFPDDVNFIYSGTGIFGNNNIKMSLTETVLDFPNPNAIYGIEINAIKQ